MTRLVVSARIGTQRVAFDAASVEAVTELGLVTPVPFAPPHISGLAAVRSHVVTVVDVAAAVGAGRSEPGGTALLASVDGHRYALRVDSVDDVVAADVESSRASGPACSWSGAAIGRARLENGLAVMLDPAHLVAMSQN